jgi:integrase
MKLTEGTIKQRTDGRFEGRIYINGRQKSVYGKTYKECLIKLNDLIDYRDRYVNDIKLYAWLDDWLSLYKKPKLKESSFKTLEIIINAYIKGRSENIKSKFENKLLKEITAIDLQKFLLGVDKTRTRESLLNIFMGSFQKAYAMQLIDFNPMIAVDLPAHKRIQGTSLTADELRDFLNVIKGTRLESFFKFCLYTGCRRGEALSVRMSDIDFENHVIHIRGTKTEKSDRYIPLFENVSELVEGLGKVNFLFSYKNNYVTKIFKQFCPTHKLHDLRHTFASICFSNGVTLKVVQAWLGHSEIDTTANIYVHLNQDIHLIEAEKIKDAFMV